MVDLRICFEIQGLAADKEGNPCPAGIEMTIVGAKEEIEYSELAKNVNISGVLLYAGLSGIVKPEDVRIIAPEEYDRLCGGDERAED